MPLTELVHYFNKRNRLVRGGEDEGFRFVDGQVRMHFGGRVFGTRFQPIVERAGSQPAGHEAHLHVLGATAAPAQTVFLEARDDAELGLGQADLRGREIGRASCRERVSSPV